MLIDKVRSAVLPRESVTRTVNEEVPPAVGMPAMEPFDVSRRPAGSDPAEGSVYTW